MNSAEAIVGELVPGQEEPLQHVDDTPPSAVVADDAPQSTEDHIIADDPIEVSVPEQPIEVDGTPVVEEEVPTDDVVAPPAHDIPIDNDVEAVAEPAPVTEPILEALEESTSTDAAANDAAAEALPAHDPVILDASGEMANGSAEQPEIISGEPVEVSEEPAEVEDAAIPAAPEVITVEHSTEEVVADPAPTSDELVPVLEKSTDSGEHTGNEAIADEPIAAAPTTEEPEIVEDTTAPTSVEPVQAIEEVAQTQVTEEVAASSSADVAEDSEESVPLVPVEDQDEVPVEVSAESAHGKYFILPY